jgi:hypothetical protein
VILLCSGFRGNGSAVLFLAGGFPDGGLINGGIGTGRCSAVFAEKFPVYGLQVIAGTGPAVGVPGPTVGTGLPGAVIVIAVAGPLGWHRKRRALSGC